MNRRGHAEEAPLAGRHEEVVGVQDGRVGQQKVLQFHVLVLAPEGKGHVNQYSFFFPKHTHFIVLFELKRITEIYTQ